MSTIPSSPHSTPSTRIRIHQSPISASISTRNSIIHSSAKGWSPLQINKDDYRSGLSLSPSPEPNTQSGPRRTSNSFKVVTSNSLVSNSPFKSPQAGGTGEKGQVIHERRSTRQLGEVAPSARGVGSTPKTVIGLGISAKRSGSRSPSGGAAVNGQRKVSGERPRVAFPVSNGERRSSGERDVSGSKENESPDVRYGKRLPRASMGLKGLVEGSYVSKSPFKKSPSGLSAASDNQADEAASAAPGTVPVEMDDVFSSPSPRRISGGKQRRASPGTLGSMAHRSPTFSSPRSVASNVFLAPPPNGLSPLREQLSASYHADLEPMPTPTAQKSALTPSRRLRGPRRASQGYDSPSKKTVTFQPTPDVKEYEILSAEPSADGSFDVEMEDEADWEDERQNSLDDLLIEEENVSPNEQIEQESHDDHDAQHNESTTADFMDTLVQEGLFSPPEMDTPAFQDQAAFEIPLETSFTEAENESDRPYLATPSLGDSVHASPLFGNHDVFSETDSAGIPYGRTHHAERAAEAHKTVLHIPIEQPSLPHAQEHRMLFNANAAQPSILPPITPTSPSFYHDYNDPFASVTPSLSSRAPEPKSQQGPEPHAHQSGPLPDPFITLQTATKTILPSEESKNREEDGVPLGRTSHKDRVLAARMLATRELGLGMPGRPNRSVPTLSPPTSPLSESEPVFEWREEEVVEEKPIRKLPKVPPPAPMPVEVPSPVMSPQKEIEENKLVVGGFSLPDIDKTSPFFNSAPTFEQAVQPLEERATSPSISGIDSKSESVSDDIDRPLTPPTPRSTVEATKPESPHRLPEFNFNFETINFDSAANKGEKVVKSESIPFGVSSVEQKEVTAPIEVERATKEDIPKITSNSASDFSPSPLKSQSQEKKTTHDSTTNRIRQRISREMIRETIQQRIADGSLSRRPASMDMDTLSKSFSRTSLGDFEMKRNRRVSMDKDLPPPPAESPAMVSSAPSTPSKPRPKSEILGRVTCPQSQSHSAERPGMRPRSQTQSAHEVFKQSEREGGEAKSALDKIVALVRRDAGGNKEGGEKMERDVSGTIAAAMSRVPTPGKEIDKPAGILRNPNGLLDANSKAEEFEVGPGSPVSKRRVSNNVRPISETSISPRSSFSGTQSSKDGPTAREQAIIAKRRQDRDRQVSTASAVSAISVGSRKSRRSLSMGDVNAEISQAKSHRHTMMGPPNADNNGTPSGVAARRGTRGNPRLTLGIDDEERSILDAFREEVDHIGSERGYKVRELPVVRASYNGKIAHSNAGNLEVGKAWKALRRPSDLHEHAAAIKAMRERETELGKATGTIFVKVLGIEGVQFPIPQEQTHFCITLDNGIDYIKTPYSVLKESARVNQEFSLVEHPSFEFSLSIDIRRDPHILKLIHEKNNPPRPTAPASPAKAHGGHFRALFGSPRKPKGPVPKGAAPKKDVRLAAPASTSTVAKKETIANYLLDSTNGTIAKTHIQFKTIAKNCEARVLEIRYPMFAMFKGDASNIGSLGSGGSGGSKEAEGARRALAKITLQVFRLPPIPGLNADELPQCIDDCLRGLRHHAWHEHEYYDGVLTQDGGDLNNPKRRLFKIIGGNLVAINEVTKKKVAMIDLRQAVSIIDLNEDQPGTPKSKMTMRPRDSDEGFGQRPRSFMIEFKDGEGIMFMADTDMAKAGWMEVLQGLVGKIPSNPLWAELLTLRIREKAAKRSASSGSLAKEGRKVSVKRPSAAGKR
ncbi:hypothetical protein C361_02285 [Cryptococcus neoformans Tu259-1]|uniref:PH domain-containing protein n=1 Tax=Cryptococcus neoformans Tu259-1 TaxID=1230072 RepID=A0A854QMI9_CRYNE|nr:hypothetical protein C361_02285 [Cryptococcus neoformans var. grubii Tu259-1]